jgi:hypothetical protein
MNAGDLYVTPTKQERLIVGIASNGDTAFATRGGNTTHDYDRCEMNAPAKFSAGATLARNVGVTELARVRAKFAPYIVANKIK